MKNKKVSKIMSLIVICLFLTTTIQFVGSEKIEVNNENEEEQTIGALAKPWVIFNGISDVDPFGPDATFSATLMSKGFTDCCDLFFVYDTQWHMNWFDYPHQTSSESYCGFCPHGFSQTESAFQRGIEYNVRAVAQNPGNSDQTFAYYFTPGEPIVETRGASNIDYTSLTVQGELIDNGEADTQVCFYYDTEIHTSPSDYPYSTEYQTLSEPGLFEETITGLPIGETVYYIAYAVNDASNDAGSRKAVDLWGAHFDWYDADGNATQTTINFDASMSCGDDSITLYEWDYENDSFYDYSDTSPYASNNYGDTNPYECKLRITNNYGQIDTKIKTVQAVSDGNSNTPPETPSKPNGVTEGQTGESYTYTTVSTDSDGDLIKYGFDWDGDNNIDEWSDYYNSGVTCQMDHSWENPGEYSVKVKAQDIRYAKSSFSNSLDVTIEGGSGGENEIPTVDITNPNNGETVSGTINIQGTANDIDGTVTKVEVKIKDGNWIQCTGTESWSYIFDTTTVPDGDCIIRARSFDGEDYSTIDSITVSIQNGNNENDLPIVDITSHDEYDTVSGLVTIQGTASDSDGVVTKVEIEINEGGFEQCIGTTTWSYDLDTNMYSDGDCYIEVRSIDDEGASSDIFELTLIIDNNNGGENNDPVLSYIDGYELGINKKEGYPDTDFEFKIYYYDEDHDSPQKKDLNIKGPDGNWNTYTMDGFGYDNYYSFSNSFKKTGLYQYSFEFTDGNGGACTLPKYGSSYFTINDPPQQGAEKPELNVGDTWNYYVNKIDGSAGLDIWVVGEIENLQVEVVAKDSNTYTLEFNGEFIGEIQLLNDDGDPVMSSREKTAPISGTIYLDRKTLGVKRIEVTATVYYGKLIQKKKVNYVHLYVDDPYDFLQFPIVEGETWDIDHKSFFYDKKTDKYREKLNGDWKLVKEGKWNEYTLGFNEHKNTCTKVQNGEYKIESNLDHGVEYSYSPNKKTVTHSKGHIEFWEGHDEQMALDYEMELKGCPPNKPSTPNGNNKPKKGNNYKYSTKTTDPNNDLIQYGWDWNGDKKVDEWTSFYESGDTCIVTHTFTKEEIENGNIYVIAKDIDQEQSPWSDPLEISSSKEKTTNSIPYILERFFNEHKLLKIFFEKVLEKRVSLF